MAGVQKITRVNPLALGRLDRSEFDPLVSFTARTVGSSNSYVGKK